MTFVFFDSVCLQQLSVHAVELDQKVFIEGKSNLAQANFIEHHERDQIFLILTPMVNHVHIDDIVLYYNIVSILALYLIIYYLHRR